MTKQQIKLNVHTLHLYLLIGLAIVLLFSLYTIVKVREQFVEVKPPEPPKLAKLMLTLIVNPQCNDCFDPMQFAAAVRQIPLTNVSVETVTHDSIEGQKLIKQYALTRVPAAVVTGEIENVTVPGFTKTDDAYVFADSPPPYYDLSLGGVVGRVQITYLTDKACPLCFDVTQFGDQLEQIGVTITSERTVDATDRDGIELIKKYGITKVPTMLMNKDALAYDIIKQAWAQVGSEEADGMLVLRNASAPYRDLDTRQVRGLVTITYLVDKTCTACYNASMHKLVLEQSFGMKFKDEKTYDITSPIGKKLVEQYGITQVPTFLLDEEAGAYASFAPAWQQVGTHAADGTFVFTQVGLLQGITYKDLTTNTVVNATG